MRLAGACLAFFMLGGPAAWAGDIAVMTEDYPPFNYEQDGRVVGAATDRVVAMFKRAGIPYTLSLQPWQRAYNAALTQADFCVYSTARTAERLSQFKWVGPLVSNHWALFARADSAIKADRLDDARPYRIGSYQGDAIASFLAHQAFAIDTALNDDLNLRKLEAGRIDLWATGRDTGLYLAAKAKIDVRMVLDFNQIELDMACNPGTPDAVIAKLNQALAETGPAITDR